MTALFDDSDAGATALSSSGTCWQETEVVPFLEAKQVILSFIIFMSKRLVRRWWGNLHSQFFRVLQVCRIKSALLRS